MNILIIGCGNIGSRHIESILKSKKKINIHVVDNSIKNLTNAKKKFKKFNNNKINLIFKNNLIDFKIIFDYLIIATNSDVRKDVYIKCLDTNKFKNVIFEKIAFTNIDEYLYVIKISQKNKINTYVNFPRRSYPFYNKIKKLLKKNKHITINVFGNNWGLASNSFHFLDLFCFLTDTNKLNHLVSKLDENILKSKRKNFIEFTGSIEIENNKNDILNIKDHLLKSKFHSDNNFIITIYNDNKIYIINEKNKIYYEVNKDKLLKVNKLKISIPLQSELTLKILEQHHRNKNMTLPKLKDCLNTHKVLLNIFSNKLFKSNLRIRRHIPIT